MTRLGGLDQSGMAQVASERGVSSPPACRTNHSQEAAAEPMLALACILTHSQSHPRFSSFHLFLLCIALRHAMLHLVLDAHSRDARSRHPEGYSLPVNRTVRR